MKILHTSDLHLGQLWDRHSRQDDQARVLAEILALADEHDVDLLLITGDVFADRVEGSIARVARQFLEYLRAPLKRGRAVFLLRGNHDPAHLFTLMDLLVNEMAGRDKWPLTVADRPGIYRVPGHPLQVVALPYLTPSALATEPIEPSVAPAARVAGLAGLLAARVEQLYRLASPDAPTIFAGHILISGSEIKPDREIEEAYHREIWLDPAHLPRFTSYNALGHIHLSQEVKGVGKPTWYAGAPDRTDRGERDYEPQVLLVTTPDQPGGVATVQPLRLTTCTPFVDVSLNGQEEVDRFIAGCGTPDPLGEVSINGIPVAARGLVEAQIKRVAPRVRVRWALEGAPTIAATGSDTPDPHDVPATVADYLSRAFPSNEAKRGRLMAAFEQLWSESRESLP